MTKHDTNESSAKIATLRQEWSETAKDSDMGIWWLAADVREAFGAHLTEDEVRTITLDALKPLLESSQLRAGDLLDGGVFSGWGGSARQQLERIEREWKEFMKPPTIGDIVWFIGPRGDAA